MSFWRRWLKQWGYVRIRDYGLVVTDAGQVIRVSDGAVVNGVMAPRTTAVLPPAYSDPRPPTPKPLPSPVHERASAEPAPAFAPPRPRPPIAAPPPAPQTPATLPSPVPKAALPRLPLPPVPRTAAPPPRRRPAASTAPPIATRPPIARDTADSDTFDEARGDTTVVDEEPTVRNPPLRAGVATRRSLPRIGSVGGIGAQVGDATVVDPPPTGERERVAPLPRLSARLAARRKA